METNTLEVQIPFSGFYYSIHDSELDHALENMFSNDCGDKIDALYEKAFELVDWKQAHIDYAKEYVEAFAAEFELDSLEFSILASPKYYNFETDRIFATISEADVLKLWNAVTKETIKAGIKARFTSRSGFISHYPNSLDDWPENVLDWDYNQLGTLLAVYVEQETGDNFEQYQEYELFDYPHEVAWQCIERNIKDAARLFTIYDYLRKREERRYNT